MPVKYAIYRVICFITLAFTCGLAALFLYFLTQKGGLDASDKNVIPALLIFCSSLAVYLASQFWGIQLIKKLRQVEYISKLQVTAVVIFFCLQLIVQVYLAYQCVDMIKATLYMMRMRYRVSGLYAGISMQILVLLIFFLTIYLQIFTFPLINRIKKNYMDRVSDIDNLFSSQD